MDLTHLSLNENLANKKITLPYPHVKVLSTNDALALVVPSLPEGDLPVICEYNGKTWKIGSLLKSALVLNTLSKISPIRYCLSSTESRDITCSEDILEVLS